LIKHPGSLLLSQCWPYWLNFLDHTDAFK
jgi:hypothetical protein